MQKNTDKQRERRRTAWTGAVTATIFRIGMAIVLFWLRWYYGMTGIPGLLMIAVAVLDLATIIPVWILLKQRLREIEGGEEDAAAQY